MHEQRTAMMQIGATIIAAKARLANASAALGPHPQFEHRVEAKHVKCSMKIRCCSSDLLSIRRGADSGSHQYVVVSLGADGVSYVCSNPHRAEAARCARGAKAYRLCKRQRASSTSYRQLTAAQCTVV
jgi:hypothetical protein